MLEHDAQRQFGAWLRSVREQLGLRRPEVAQALGYTNISKGCSRLAGWERGDAHPDHHFHAPLRTVLQISTEEWDSRLEDREEQRRHADPFTASTRDQLTQLRQDLAHHCDLLLEHHPRIAATPHWRDIQLPGLHFGMMYIGGITTVYLGDLLASWEAGALQVSDHDGQVIWLLSGGASPLSGSHSVHGFFRQSRKCADFKNTFRGAIAGPLSDIIRRTRAADHSPSPWNLSQLLAHLGVPLAPAVLSSSAGTVGQYDFSAATLHWQGAQVVFPQLHTASPVPPEEPAPAAAETWDRQPGCLRDPLGYPQVRWSRALPSPVLDWLILQLMNDPLPISAGSPA